MSLQAKFGLAIAMAVALVSPVVAQPAIPSWKGFYAGLNAGETPMMKSVRRSAA